jgi:glycosyltransferase involved in cell wall biosynthesis
MSRGLGIAMVAACPFPYPRGTPVRIHRMAEALARRGHRVHVVTYHLGQPLLDPPFEIHRTPRLPTYRKESPGPSLQKLAVVDLLLTWRLRQVLRRHPIDVIHAHHYEGLLAAAAANRHGGPPVIYDAHTALESELGHYLPRPLHHVATKAGTWLDAVLPRQATRVIVVSEALRQRLVGNGAVAPERVTVIGNGVEQAHFEVPADRRAAVRSPETLIFTGNLAPYQGIDLLLQAFRLVLEQRPSARLLMVTDSSFAPYESLATELGIRRAIEVTDGTFEELPDFLAQSAVAVNPRIRCHGIPMKVLNYLAAAKPIVSFAGSAHGLEESRAAWIVPDGDIRAFADGIITLLDHPDLARELGANGREFSRTNLSWDNTARRVEAVYAAALGDGTAAQTPETPAPLAS